MNSLCYVFLVLGLTLTQQHFFAGDNYHQPICATVSNLPQDHYVIDTNSVKATLPISTELPAYLRCTVESTEINEKDHNDLYRKGVRYYGDFIGWRGNEGTYHFRVEVTLYDSPESAKKSISDAMKYILATGEMQEHSYRKRKIGNKVWSSTRGSLLVVLDGRATVSVKVGPFVLRDEAGIVLYDDEGTPLIYRPTWEDALFAETLAVDTLSRLTVLGMTSKPARQASSRAKRQVAERYEALLLKQKPTKQ
ncbi:MAG: hypothetical protein OHK0029_03070 [Armatimonadaceae bacterium]